jgi:hypothetical protein
VSPILALADGVADMKVKQVEKLVQAHDDSSIVEYRLGRGRNLWNLNWKIWIGVFGNSNKAGLMGTLTSLYVKESADRLVDLLSRHCRIPCERSRRLLPTSRI